MIKKITFSIVLSVMLCTCSSDDINTPNDNTLETIFIGIFDNEWHVQGVDDHFIGIFRDGPEDTSSGILMGFENHPEKGFAEMVSGTFDGLDIEFTIPRNNGTENIVFTGKMTPESETDHSIIRMDFTTSDGETLVLETL